MLSEPSGFLSLTRSKMKSIYAFSRQTQCLGHVTERRSVRTVGLMREPEADKRIKRERRVADPRRAGS